MKGAGLGNNQSHLMTSFARLLKSKLGCLLVLTVCLAALVNFLTVYQYQLPPSWFYTFPDAAQKNYYFTTHLTKTWTHLSAFLIGLLAGHLCRSSLKLRYLTLLKNPGQSLSKLSPAPSNSTSQSRLTSLHSHGSSSTIMAMELDNNRPDDCSSETRSSSSVSRNKQASGSRLARKLVAILALSTLAIIVFSTYEWSTQALPSTSHAALYDALSRLLWSLALVTLMIQLCTPGSDTNSFSSLAALLSHPFFLLIGRLSFIAYLLSPYVHTFVLAVEEQSLFPSLFIMFHVIVGNIVITYLLAFLVAIVIEQPARRFIGLLINGPSKLPQPTIVIDHYYEAGCSKQPTVPLPERAQG